MRLRDILNWVLLASFWGLLYWQLSYEFSVSAQYSYGLFVPFLGIYLLYLRFADRPQPMSADYKGIWGFLVFCGLLLYFPCAIIFEANADWRMIIWIQGLIALFASLLLVYTWGGRSWLQHFILAFIFFLFAIPWPSVVMANVNLRLMGFVASATVDTVNILGIYAKQAGNIIILKNSIVSIEEACSGLRSLQSTLMAAYFLAELLRFSIPWRIIVLIAGSFFAIFFNYIRTLFLTITIAQNGEEVLDILHDPAGYFVFLLSLLSLVVFVFIIWKCVYSEQRNNESIKEEARGEASYLGTVFCGVGIVLLLLTPLAAQRWYQQPEFKNEAKQAPWRVDWERLGVKIKEESIPPRLQDALFYDDGEFVSWKETDSSDWMAYFLSWNSARAGQLGGIHSPDICLPSFGWKLLKPPTVFVWHGPDDLQLIFNCYQFQNANHKVYVFDARWDSQNYPYHTKLGREQADRWLDVWNGNLKENKRLLEFLTPANRTMAEAQQELKQILDKVVVH